MDATARNKQSTDLLLEVVRLINAHGHGGNENQEISEQATAVGHVAIQLSSTGRLKGNRKVYRQHNLTMAMADIDDITVRVDGPGDIYFGPYLLFKFNKPVMVRHHMFHVGMESLDVPPRWQESAWEEMIVYIDSQDVGDSIREKLAAMIRPGHGQPRLESIGSPQGDTPIRVASEPSFESETFRIVEEED